MSGMKGFVHSCTEKTINKKAYGCSLKNSSFTDLEINMIWDFYVARSFAASTNNAISLKAYGWDTSTGKTSGLPALEKALAQNAGITSFAIIRYKTIKDTLQAMGLSDDYICITHPRAVLTQRYSAVSDENENIKIHSEENRIAAIFRHIRNSLAHGNTYFFDNGMCLLEDKDVNTKTAAILMPKQSLIDWIFIVDQNSTYYTR